LEVLPAKQRILYQVEQVAMLTCRRIGPSTSFQTMPVDIQGASGIALDIANQPVSSAAASRGQKCGDQGVYLIGQHDG
jgi:hypothetical protein